MIFRGVDRQALREKLRRLPASGHTLVLGERLIDGSGAAPIERGAVLIEGDRIVAAGPRDAVAAQAPPSAAVVETAGATVLPGLIDAHVHIKGETTFDAYRRYLTPSLGEKLLRAVAHAQMLLVRGFTTVRDISMGSGVTIRKAAEQGWVDAPRIRAAVTSLSATGGHGDWHILPYEWARSLGQRSWIVDGVDECRRAARLAFRAGADVIKIHATGSGVTNHPADLAPWPQLSPEEMAAIVDEAHRRGAKVAAHAHGAPAIEAALRARVDTIEHGRLIPPERYDVLDLMAERGAYFVPTPALYHWTATVGPKHGVFPAGVEAARVAIDDSLRIIGAARERGVRLVAGTDDTGVLAPGDNAVALELLVQAGLSPLEAITAATRTAAEALGIGDQVGTLEPGKRADVLVVRGDPSRDVSLLRDPSRIVTIIQSQPS